MSRNIIFILMYHRDKLLDLKSDVAAKNRDESGPGHTLQVSVVKFVTHFS
jgi:hypothetical protein